MTDLDYVEQVAPAGIKSLFDLDTSEVNEQVLQSPKSLDGEAIVSAVDHAIETGDWSDARDIRAYIKSRRRKLTGNLNQEQERDLEQFLPESAKKGLFILSRGAIEAYLPVGYKGKRIDRLIELINLPDFLEKLPSEADELHKIVETIIEWVERQTNAKGLSAELAQEAVA